jgi:integral membrane protein
MDSARLDSALARYRVIAYVVGVFLLLLTVATVLDLGWHQPAMASVVGPIHGVLYMVYLVLTFNLAVRARWPWKYTVLVMLAGTVPFLSFVAERSVTHRVRAAREPALRASAAAEPDRS